MGQGDMALTWRTSVRSSSRGIPRELSRAFGRSDVVRPSIEARVSVGAVARSVSAGCGGLRGGRRAGSEWVRTRAARRTYR